MLALRDQQGEGAKLTLEIESAQAVYKRALEGYDQIMFASTSDGANTSIVSRAAPPVKAAKPNVKKLLAVAFLASVLAGVGGPFAYELFVRRRIRCRDDVERLLGVPVLAHFAQGSP